MFKFDRAKWLILFFGCSVAHANYLKCSFSLLSSSMNQIDIKQCGKFDPAINKKDEKSAFNYSTNVSIFLIGLDYMIDLSEKTACGIGLDAGYRFSNSFCPQNSTHQKKDANLTLGNGDLFGIGPRILWKLSPRINCLLACDVMAQHVGLAHNLEHYPRIITIFWNYQIMPKLRLEFNDENKRNIFFISIGYGFNLNDSLGKYGYSHKFITKSGDTISTLSTDLDVQLSNSFLLEFGFCLAIQ